MTAIRVIGIIPARLDSSRLPGKALKTVNGIPLLGYVFERSKKILGITKLVLATTSRTVDEPLTEYAESQGISVYRGDLDDVAHRMLNCAKKFEAEYFIRLNGDSPFPDKQLIGDAIGYCCGREYDLITNLIDRTFPYGISVEIVKTETYEKMYNEMKSSEEKEHVTKRFYAYPEQFKIKSIVSENSNLKGTKIVVDTHEDFDTFEKVVGELGEDVFTAGYQSIAELYFSVQS